MLDAQEPGPTALPAKAGIVRLSNVRNFWENGERSGRTERPPLSKALLDLRTERQRGR